MKTSTEIIDMIYKYLVTTPLVTANDGLSGGVYPLQRPEGSNKEDLVIGTLSLDGEDVQIGVLNLNLHIPNLNVVVGGKPQKQPNRARMRVLSGKLRDAISEHYFDGACSAWITNIAEIKETNLDDWYVNHRLEIRFHFTQNDN